MADRPIYDEDTEQEAGECGLHFEHDCPILPEGTKVVIEPDLVDSRTKGGLWLPQQSQKMEQNAVTTGTLVKIGPEAEIHFGIEQGEIREASPGDRVIFARYGGVEIKWGKKRYRIVQDADVVGFLTKEPPVGEEYDYRTI